MKMGSNSAVARVVTVQILNEAMLEDIDCLLGSGQVPNLFVPEEEADIVARLRGIVRANGKPETEVSDMYKVAGQTKRSPVCSG